MPSKETQKILDDLDELLKKIEESRKPNLRFEKAIKELDRISRSGEIGRRASLRG